MKKYELNAITLQTNLSRKFKVSGIPTLILLDGETGAVLTADGRSIVAEDPEGTQFPWKPKPLSELIGEEFVTTGLKEVGKEAIEGKVLGLYFSAHWVSLNHFQAGYIYLTCFAF